MEKINYQEEVYKKINNQMEFEASLMCKGCEYCLSGNYYHPLGYSFAIKRIAGKREAWIIFGSVGIFTILFVLLLLFVK